MLFPQQQNNFLPLLFFFQPKFAKVKYFLLHVKATYLKNILDCYYT